MTDAELLARLRNPDPDSIWSYEMGKAATRIEAIEAKLAKVETLMDAGLAEYERRLAKAVEALEESACEFDCPIARATLAELKGESHD